MSVVRYILLDTIIEGTCNSVLKTTVSNINKMDKGEMKYAGVLPYSYDKTGLLMFLLGREAMISDWTEGGKWSDFGKRATM